MVFLRKKELVVVLLFLLLNPMPSLVNGSKPNSQSKRFGSRKTCLASVEEALKGAEVVVPMMHFETTSDGIQIDNAVKDLLNFAKGNPDKIAIAIGLAASSCLLYDAIVMVENVKSFFDQYKELKGMFDSYYKDKMETLTARFNSIKITAHASKEQQKQDYQLLYKEMQEFSIEIDRHLVRVEDVMESLADAQLHNNKLTILSAGLAAIAVGAALLAAPAYAHVVKTGVVDALNKAPVRAGIGGGIATASISGTAFVFSLQNEAHLSIARVTLKGLKAEVGRMKTDTMNRLADIILSI